MDNDTSQFPILVSACLVGLETRYNGKVNIGFGVDKKLIPDVGRLGELVTAEFADIVEQTVGS